MLHVSKAAAPAGAQQALAQDVERAGMRMSEVGADSRGSGTRSVSRRMQWHSRTVGRRGAACGRRVARSWWRFRSRSAARARRFSRRARRRCSVRRISSLRRPFPRGATCSGRHAGWVLGGRGKRRARGRRKRSRIAGRQARRRGS